MWLLKLHIAISILCLLTFVGFKSVFKDKIKEHGYSTNEKKSTILDYWVFLIPLLNIAMTITVFVAISIKKEDLNRFKGSEIEIDIHRISSKNLKRSQEEIEVESPTEILNTFINQQNIDEEKKKKLIDKGQELLQRV